MNYCLKKKNEGSQDAIFISPDPFIVNYCVMPKDLSEIEQLFILSQLKKDKKDETQDSVDEDFIPTELDINKIIDDIETDILGDFHQND
jgi:hypothetical protein